MTPVVILICWVFCFLTTTSAIPSHFPNSIQVINSNSYGSSDRKAKFESQIPSTTTRNWKCRNWKDNALRCCKMKFRNAFNGLRNRKDLISDNNGMERRTFRKVNFWSRAFRIYSSYKIFQAKKKVEGLLLFGLNKILKRNTTSSDEIDWDRIHNINSDRMLHLCLSLRGFYLKSGQFLATRYDFMPLQYISKLRVLHDSVPPLKAEDVRRILTKEMGGPLEAFFSELDLTDPIGSASVAQVHRAVWRSTGEKVAVKVQNPQAERLMTGDLRNLVLLARFLQKTELKFDILSALLELQKQIKNEFDFVREARNMDSAGRQLAALAPGVCVPRSLFCSKRALVMTYVEGVNLGKLQEFNASSNGLPSWAKKIAGKKILKALAQAWGAQLFQMRMFHADPHPGNICLDIKGANGKGKGAVGLLDWGQVKFVSKELSLAMARMVEAINSGEPSEICQQLKRLGVEISNTDGQSGSAPDEQAVASIAVTMLDTKQVPGYVLNPFDPNHSLKKNAVTKLPPDLYFLVRTIQLLKGISFAFDIDFSVAKEWAPLARKTILEAEARS